MFTWLIHLCSPTVWFLLVSKCCMLHINQNMASETWLERTYIILCWASWKCVYSSLCVHVCVNVSVRVNEWIYVINTIGSYFNLYQLQKSMKTHQLNYFRCDYALLIKSTKCFLNNVVVSTLGLGRSLWG